MMKQLSWPAILLLINFSVNGVLRAVEPPVKYAVSVQLKGLKSGKLFLSSLSGSLPVTDTAVISAGTAVFRGSIKEPHLCRLSLSETPSASMLIYLEAGNISVTGSKDSLQHLRVNGGKYNRQLNEWERTWENITASTSAAYKRGYEAARHNNGVVPDSLAAIINDLHSRLEPLRDTAMTQFLKKYPQSPVSAYVVHLRYISYPSGEVLVRHFGQMLGKQAMQSEYGRKINAYLQLCDKTAIGSLFAVAQTDTSGKLVSSAAFKGKYLLVDFWASWCGPCRKENPNVVEAYKSFRDLGFEVLGISLDSDHNAWMKAVHKDNLTWTHVSDLKGWKNAIAVQYGINTVPTNLLLDKTGRIIAKDLRGEALPATLKKLMNL